MRLPKLLRAMPRWPSPPPATRTLLAGVALAATLFIVVYVAVLIDVRREAAQRASAVASQLATAVAQDVGHSIDSYDRALQALIAALGTPGVRDLSPPLRNLALFDRVAGARHVGFIEVLDANGDVLASSPPAQHVTNWSNRDYFIAHRRDASPELHVGLPFATAQEEFASVTLSRRLSDADGSFAGVAVIGVRLAYFRALFSKLDLAPNGSITLLRDDGIVLMRLPFERNDIGRLVSITSPFGSYLRGGATGLTAAESTNHVTAQFAFRRIGELPLVVAVGLGSDSFRIDWWVGSLAVAGVALAAISLLLLRRLWRELRQRETAERDSRAKSSLLATLSHELRTPLHGILGHAEQLLTEGTLAPSQSRHVSAIVSTGQHMRGVVNWALDSAWIEARGPKLQMTLVDIPQLIEQCRAIVEPSATARGLHLWCIAKPNAPLGFVTDSALLRQILLNLLDNAIKYTREGGIELRLALIDGQLVFEVADTGIGIPVEQRHKLFHEYERLGAERSTVEGTGLGLAMAARLVRRLGGDIGYRDNPGGGSVFWFKLPRGEAVGSGAPTAVDADSPRMEKLCVLVADDTAPSRAVASAFLRSAGHEVIEARNGVEAVRLAALRDFDVVLMDMRMDGIDGLEATQQIQAIEGPRGRVPIIAMTADALDGHVTECLRAGMAAHLPKPFGSKELLAVIAKVARRNTRRPNDQGLIVDVEVLAQLAHHMGGEALDTLVRGLSERIEGLQRKLAERDALACPQLLADMVHELVGSAGTLGLAQLSNAARRVQDVIGTDPAGAREPLDALREAAEDALDALRRGTAFGPAVAA